MIGERFVAVRVERTSVTWMRSAVFSLLLLLPGFGAAEDFKLSDGTVFRGARVLEVRPDALVLLHERGIAMADLAKLPRAVRVRFRYDPHKAAAYRIRETEKRQAQAEEKRLLITAREKQEEARARTQLDAAEVTPEGSTGPDETQLSFRMNDVDRNFAAAVSYMATEIAQKEEARISEARTSQTFWGAPFWRHPLVAMLCGLFSGGAGSNGSSSASRDGSNSEPRNWR